MPEISEVELNRLKNAVGELSTLNQIANAINVTMSVDKITSVIVERCRRRVKAGQGAIFLLEEEQPEEDRFRTFVREVSSDDGGIPFHLNQSLQGWMMKHRTILLSNDPGNDDRLRGVDFAKIGLHSLVAAPLMSRRGLVGILVLFNKTEGEGFTENDARFLGIVGTQVSKVIENARLFEREQQLAIIEEEIKIAKSIQTGFLPKENLVDQRFEVYGLNTPAREVGGDYYDIIRLNEDSVLLSIGDISGKGLPAALLMSNAQAVMRSRLHAAVNIDLPELAGCLNQLFYQFSAPEQYITALFGLFSRSRSEFTYINAGHLPPLVRRTDGNLDTPDAADLVIGVIPEVRYTEHTLRLDPGDYLVLYTDGVTEAVNPGGAMFGEERFEQFVQTNAANSAEAMCRSIQAEVAAYRDTAEQSDDITLLALRPV